LNLAVFLAVSAVIISQASDVDDGWRGWFRFFHGYQADGPGSQIVGFGTLRFFLMLPAGALIVYVFGTIVPYDAESASPVELASDQE
jgi:hypothetical protein